MNRLKDENIILSPKKCKFGVGEVEFLGHVIDQNGIRMMRDKLEAIANWPAPGNVRQLRRFLGLTGYYRRFIRGYADIAADLTCLLHLDSRYIWQEPQRKAFTRLKQAIMEEATLKQPDYGKPFILECDASGVALGAALMQKEGDGNPRPVAFLSRQFKDAELRYATHEKETLTIIYALKTWRHYLFGQKVFVFTDHKSIQYLLTQPNLSLRQWRWKDTLAEFDLKIEYKKGVQNNGATRSEQHTHEMASK
jgi:hypothetical protein